MDNRNPHVMLNLSAITDKPKYTTSIKQAHNGFIVNVELDQALTAPMSQEEVQRRLGEFMSRINDQAEYSSDPFVAKVQKAERAKELAEKNKEIKEEKKVLVGPHIFTSYSEMSAFLSFVYEQNALAEN